MEIVKKIVCWRFEKVFRYSNAVFLVFLYLT